MTFAPKHHPAEDTLLHHAAATLAPARSLVIATHLPFCPDCQAATRRNEELGGALLADLPPAELTADALTRTLARLEQPAAVIAPPEEPIALAEGVPLPAALRGLVRPKWRRVAPGISCIPVHVPTRDTRQRAMLLRVAPGRGLPDHGHEGWEATCVLTGSFSDVSGEYGPGDVAELDGTPSHEPVAGPGEDCVCLIAWEGRLRMHGLLARLMQPFLGV